MTHQWKLNSEVITDPKSPQHKEISLLVQQTLEKERIEQLRYWQEVKSRYPGFRGIRGIQ